MEIILVLIPVTLVIVGLALAAFFWAVDDGQYEDVERRGSESLFAADAEPVEANDPTNVRRGAQWP
jgi:cbb3-type cytochrome oxidase maturation protein